jgi:hypothetical protein
MANLTNGLDHSVDLPVKWAYADQGPTRPDLIKAIEAVADSIVFPVEGEPRRLYIVDSGKVADAVLAALQTQKPAAISDDGLDLRRPA